MNELQRVPRNMGRPSRQAYADDAEIVDVQGVSQREGAGLLEDRYMALRNKGTIVLAGLLGGIGGFLLTLDSPRIYQARTTLEVQGYNNDFLNMGTVNPTNADAGYDAVGDLQTHVRILQSRTMRERAAKELRAKPAPPDLPPPDRLGMWRRALNMNPPTQDELYDQAVGTASGSVSARTQGVNRILEISCDSTSRQIAADYCNTLAQQYIDQNLESRWQSTEYTGQWLTKQLQDLKIKLERSQDELQGYLRQTGLIVTAGGEGAGDSANAQDVRLGDLLKALSAAQTDRIEKQSRYEMAFASAPGALSDVLDDASLKTSQASLADLKTKLAQLSVTLTPNHADVKRVQAQIAAIESSQQASRDGILARIRAEFEAATRRETLLQGEYVRQAGLVSGQSEQTAHFNLLKREVDASRMLYDNLLQRTKEASVASALRANNIRVVDSARPPGWPYSPNVPRQITIGLIFGLVLGVGFAIFREKANRTLQNPGDISHYLGVPELGVVPTGEPVAGLLSTSASSSSLMMTEGDGAPGQEIEMVSWSRQNSLLAESYRTILASILFSRPANDRPHVLVFSSASPKEGKTTTVSNIGIALAEIGHRVLLIDADMRRPRVHRVFGIENRTGLGELLLSKTPLDSDTLETSCVTTHIPGLFVLPSGPPLKNASSLLHSVRLSELLALGREQFDTVIVDTPPMVNLADARVVARLGDALIFVVRSGSTTRDAALMATSRFEEDGIPILGCILNLWNPKSPGHAQYQAYYSGYYHYYGDDGSGGSDGDGTSSEKRSHGRLSLRPHANRSADA